MIAYEVLVNGERKCLASIGEDGYLHAFLCLGGRGRSPKREVKSDGISHFHIGGMSGEDSVHWLKEGLNLKAGDELTIRVTEIESLEVADVPIVAEKSTNPRFK